MRRYVRIQRFLALWLTGGILMGASCSKVVQESAVDGFVDYFRGGGLTSTLNSTLLNDFIINALTGGFTGGDSGSSDGPPDIGNGDSGQDSMF